MPKVCLTVIAFGLMSICAPGFGQTAPLGVADAFNLVALGTVNAQGQTVIAGNVSTSADVSGRIAAAGTITGLSTVGSGLGSDSYKSLAGGYEVVAGGGISARGYINVNGGGNVYAPASSAKFNWNESPRGALVSSGSAPIDFASLRTSLENTSNQLFRLPSTGITGAKIPGANPSWLVLSGISSTSNIFYLTEAEFGDSNHPIDINVPPGLDSGDQCRRSEPEAGHRNLLQWPADEHRQ